MVTPISTLILDMLLDSIHDHFFILKFWFWFFKKVSIFGVDNNLSTHTDNSKKYVVVLGEGPTQELDDTIITAESNYSTNFTESKKKFCLSLHYNESKSFSYVMV